MKIGHSPMAPNVEILHIFDYHSRLCLTSNTQPVFKAHDVDRCYRKAAAAHGNPASLLSDNGAVFTGRYRGQAESIVVARAAPRRRPRNAFIVDRSSSPDEGAADGQHRQDPTN